MYFDQQYNDFVQQYSIYATGRVSMVKKIFIVQCLKETKLTDLKQHM